MAERLLDKANLFRKKGKLLRALKCYHQVYREEKTYKLERTIFELEQKIVAKFPDYQKKDLIVWPIKKRIESLWQKNDRQKIFPLLESLLFLNNEDKLLLGELYLEKSEGIKAWTLCQGIISSASTIFQENMKRYMQKIVAIKKMSETQILNFELNKKGLDWISTFMERIDVEFLEILYLENLYKSKRWSEGRCFIKKSLLVNRFPRILAQFNWWNIVSKNRPWEESQKKSILNSMKDVKVQKQMARLMTRQAIDDFSHLLLCYNPLQVFSLNRNYNNSDVMKGMGMALRQRKIAPKNLLNLQRLLLKNEHNALINFLYISPLAVYAHIPNP